MTDTQARCDWCRKPGATHTEEQHPLPRDHADYDAFFDASDGELAGMVAEAASGSGEVQR